MLDGAHLLDAYDRNARLYPALVVMLPITVLAALLFSLEWWSGIIGLATATGLHVFVVTLVRDRGTGVETKLWDSWGGRPSTVRMMWSNATNPMLHQRRLDSVETATGVTLPTQAEEVADPADARMRYETASDLLRDLTRDKATHPRVKTELTNYGYRRNLYGCRPLGVVAAVAAFVCEASLALVAYFSTVDISFLTPFLGALVSAAWLLVWLFVVNPGFVKRDADRYADALISSASTVIQKNAGS